MTSAQVPGPAPEIPGVTVLQEAHECGSGEIWRARDERDVAVLVRVLRLQGDPSLVEVGRWRAHALVEVSAGLAGVGPVLAVRDFDDGVGLLRPDDVPLRPRWPGSAGRPPALPVLAADGCRLAEALAGLHGREVTHGRLTRADVLVDAAGGLLLTGYGVAGVLGAPGTQSRDVTDLVQLLTRQLLSGDPDSECLRRELDKVAEGGGTARDVAACCAALLPAVATPVSAAAPAAVRLSGLLAQRPGHRRESVAAVPAARVPAGPQRSDGSGVRRLRPGWRGATIMGVLVAVAATVGWRTATPARSGGQAPAAQSCPTPLPGAKELARLQSDRSRIFGRWDGNAAAALAEVDQLGGPAAESDLAGLRFLQVKGARASGLRTQIVRVRLVGCAPGRVHLAVLDTVGTYDFVDAAGQVLARSPGHPRQEHLVTLTGGAGHWRFWEVTAPPT